MPKLARLSDRALLKITGDEARPFLNRLLTQEVETLTPGESRYAALLTPQGRVLNDLFVHGLDEGVLLDVAAPERDALAAKLRMFKLRAQVDIAPEPLEVWALWDAHAAPTGWRPDPRAPSAGFRLAGEASVEGAEPGDYAAHRFALGLPDIAADGLADKAYATEALLDLLHGVDFKKGCFVGQETTSRMKRRGGIRSRVLPLAVEGGTPGAEVLNGALRAGEVLAVHGERALALLRLDRLDGALMVENRPASIALPPWWPADEPPLASAPSDRSLLDA